MWHLSVIEQDWTTPDQILNPQKNPPCMGKLWVTLFEYLPAIDCSPTWWEIALLISSSCLQLSTLTASSFPRQMIMVGQGLPMYHSWLTLQQHTDYWEGDISLYLTHWCLNNITEILQMVFLNAFSVNKYFVYFEQKNHSTLFRWNEIDNKSAFSQLMV